MFASITLMANSSITLWLKYIQILYYLKKTNYVVLYESKYNIAVLVYALMLARIIVDIKNYIFLFFIFICLNTIIYWL